MEIIQEPQHKQQRSLFDALSVPGSEKQLQSSIAADLPENPSEAVPNLNTPSTAECLKTVSTPSVKRQLLLGFNIARYRTAESYSTALERARSRRTQNERHAAGPANALPYTQHQQDLFNRFNPAPDKDVDPYNAAAVLDAVLTSSEPVERLKEIYGLHLLNTQNILPHKEQLRFLIHCLQTISYESACSGDRPPAPPGIMCLARTGSGKSYMQSVLAVKELSGAGGRWILQLTPTTELVAQLTRDYQKLHTLPENVLISMTGQTTPPPMRTALYADKIPKIVIATPEVIQNDLQRGALDISRFKAIFYDESHHHRGLYAYTQIHQAALAAGGIRGYFFSGSIPQAHNKLELRRFKEQLHVKHFFRIRFSAGFKWYKDEILELDERTLVAATLLEDSAVELAARLDSALVAFPAIQKKLRQATHIHKLHFTFPSEKQFREVAYALQRCKVPFATGSLWWALKELQLLHSRLTTYGHFVFLNKAGHELWNLRFGTDLCHKRGRDIRALIGEESDKTAGSASRYRRHIVYRDPRLQRAFRLIAGGQATLYSEILTAPNITALSTYQQAEAPHDPKTNFFIAARQKLIQRDYSDHPKERRLMDLAQEQLWRWEDVTAIAFGGLVSQVLFLAERLNYRSAELGFTSTAIAGQGGMSRKQLQENLASFRDHRSRLLLATDVGNEGLHIASARYGYILSQSSELEKNVQQPGRVGRQSQMDALQSRDPLDRCVQSSRQQIAQVHYFITSSTNDQVLRFAGRRNFIKMQRVLNDEDAEKYNLE